MVLRVALLVVLVGFGVSVGMVGFLGWRGRLRRDGRIGVRTPDALRSEEAFALANRVAGPPALAAGLISVLAGVAALFVPTLLGVVVLAVVGLAGAVLIVRGGGALAQRAAAAIPAPPAPAGCGGCACGSGGCAALTS